MKADVQNFGVARVRMRTRTGLYPTQQISFQNAKLCKIWAASPTFWAGRKFEIMATFFQANAFAFYGGDVWNVALYTMMLSGVAKSG